MSARRFIGEAGFWTGWVANQVLAFFAIALVWAMNEAGRLGEAARKWGMR